MLPIVDARLTGLVTDGSLGVTVYVSARLTEAIASSGITGLEIKPNKRLFADR